MPKDFVYPFIRRSSGRCFGFTWPTLVVSRAIATAPSDDSRLRASIESARNELQPLMASWKAAYPPIHTGHYLFIRPLLEDVSGTIKPALLMLLGATGAVLSIVCANLAMVIMARAARRGRGRRPSRRVGCARESRFVRLSLIESALSALLGGVSGSSSPRLACARS